MADPSTHIHYSFEDIQRYLNGSMSAAEMHDIEKAALQDPFLADAMEGFNKADFAIAHQHVNEINASLLKEKKKSKVVAFNKKARLLNIAAVVIVVAAIGIVVSYILSSSANHQQKEIAKVQQQPVGNSTVNDTVSAADNSNASTSWPGTGAPVAEHDALKKITSLRAKENAAKMKAENNMNRLLPENEMKQKPEETAAIASAPAAAIKDESVLYDSFYTTTNDTHNQAALRSKTSGIETLPSTFTGKVTDEANKPIAGVTIASNDKKTSTLSDVNGNFNLKKTDTILHATAGTVGYDTKPVILQHNAMNEIVLEQSSQALNEVAITGYSADKKVKSNGATPVGGWKNFNNYIVTQLGKDTAHAYAANNDDLVELEFLIDNTGSPYDIKVTKSLSEVHSSKAKTLLENGPKWVPPANRKKTKIVINF